MSNEAEVICFFPQIMASGTEEALKSAGMVLSGDDFIFTFLVNYFLVHISNLDVPDYY